ncbi:hypothetical protein AYO40_02545 [Planctomycetaceae bacterium SCGC AG-212-D15]|nr:hypothetical protein AYO40_02545 [Planctomycetaceae bacterium SCGC AG-212-D15]
MTVKPWPHVVLSGRRLSGFEARALLEVLDVVGEILYGRFDAALRAITCDLARKVKPAQVEAVGRLLDEASHALHPGRASLRDEELTDLGLLVERLRRLAAGDEEGYARYHAMLRDRYKARLIQAREARRREASA